jgi:hypothetical protein
LAERPVRALRFTGFGLGIWPWPIVNILLERTGRAGFRSSIRGRGSLTPTMANTERWTWQDYKGRKRELIIHREVKEA